MLELSFPVSCFYSGGSLLLRAIAMVFDAYLAAPALHVAAPSPFDYEARTRVLVVTDVNRNNADQLAAAYRELFLAAGGGGLGLITAITRLRAVHQRIAGPLDEAGLTLLAQHIDGMDTGTLIDIFRAEEDWCLLGTDAVRDGVDYLGVGPGAHYGRGGFFVLTLDIGCAL